MPTTPATIDLVSDLPEPPALQPHAEALFLDLDGTLADIMPRPEQVAIAPSMRAALAEAHAAFGGRLAVVSGRSLDDVEQLIGLPSLGFAGIHGLERRLPDGEPIRARPSDGLERARAELAALGRREPRLLIEDKGLGIAVHFRLAPDLAAAAERAATAVAADNGLVLQPGKMVFEVREPGADKGATVRAFMVAPPFAGARPVFVGDDRTDEGAFAAAAELGGYGILVGEARPTAARFRLPDVPAVERWLRSARTGR